MTTHPVVWFEVVGEDGAKLRDFYGSLFGWRYDLVDGVDYGMVEGGSGGIGGGVGKGDRPQVTFYVSTKDIAASLADAERLGGKALLPRTKLPGGTVIGMMQDPQGNAVGLVEEA